MITDEGTYYVDRSPRFFNYIIDFYRYDQYMIAEEDIKYHDMITKDIEFYGLPNCFEDNQEEEKIVNIIYDKIIEKYMNKQPIIDFITEIELELKKILEDESNENPSIKIGMSEVYKQYPEMNDNIVKEIIKLKFGEKIIIKIEDVECKITFFEYSNSYDIKRRTMYAYL